MTIMTREQHEDLRLLSLASALAKGIAEMDYKADKQRYLNYLREMTDLIIMAPTNTVDGEQPLINSGLFQALHPGLGGA